MDETISSNVYVNKLHLSLRFNIFGLLNISIMYIADDVDASTFPSAHLSAPKAEVHSIRQANVPPQRSVSLQCFSLILTQCDKVVLEC